MGKDRSTQEQETKGVLGKDPQEQEETAKEETMSLDTWTPARKRSLSQRRGMVCLHPVRVAQRQQERAAPHADTHPQSL